MFTISFSHRLDLGIILVVTFFLFSNISQADQISKNATPIAVLDNSSEGYVIRKNAKWTITLDSQQVKEIGSTLPLNQYQVNDLELVENCFKKRLCSKSLSLENVTIERNKTVISASQNLGISIRKLSPDIFVAVESVRPNIAMVINAKIGRLIPQMRNAQVSSIDVRLNQVVSLLYGDSTDDDEDVCKLFGTDLEGNAKRLIANVKYKVIDLSLKDGVIYALAKKPSKKFHFSSSLLGWAGHAPAYEDWYMLEISFETGEMKESLLIEDMRNAFGYFPNKWATQLEDQ